MIGCVFVKLLKRENTGITSSLQNKIKAYSYANNDAVEEICKFDKIFIKLESEINIVKQLNTIFNKRVVDEKRQCWKKTLSIQEGSVLKL